MDLFSLFDHVLEHEPEREPKRNNSSRLPHSLERKPPATSPSPTPPARPAQPVLDPLQCRILERERNRSQASPVRPRNRPEKEPKPDAEIRTREVKRPDRGRKLDVPRDVPRAGRRDNRASQPSLAVGLRIRPEERELLTEVGKFRVISAADLTHFIYKGNQGQMESDFDFLKSKNLIEVHVLNARRDGRGEGVQRFEAVTLTATAKRLLERSGKVLEGQVLYAGLVKVREAEHDAQVYRAYLKELAQIEREGGQNPRVKLDFELKAEVQRALYQARKAEPKRELSEIKAEIAEQFQLTVSKHKVVFPDARIEYENSSGGSSYVDIEVATSAYRRSHLASKSQAGFKLYISRGDIGRLGASVCDDHDLMSQIFDF